MPQATLGSQEEQGFLTLEAKCPLSMSRYTVTCLKLQWEGFKINLGKNYLILLISHLESGLFESCPLSLRRWLEHRSTMESKKRNDGL